MNLKGTAGQAAPGTHTSRNFYLKVSGISLTALILYLLFARFDVGGEDGVYFTPALAVREGLVIHRDVFTQYGPVVSEIQAFYLRLMREDTVLSLRYLNAMLLVITGVVAAVTLRRIYSEITVLCGLITWLASAYFFSNGISMLAWPSVYSLLISVGVLALLIDPRSSSLTKRTWRLLLAGLLTGAQLFVRLNLGTTTFLGAALILLVFSGLPRGQRVWSRAAIFSSMSVATALVFTYWLWRHDALTPFLDQSVRAPAKYYGAGGRNPGITNGEIPIEHMSRFGIVYGLPAVLVLIIAVAISSRPLRRDAISVAHFLGGALSLVTAGLLWEKGLAPDPFRRFAPLYGMVVAMIVAGPVLLSTLAVASWREIRTDTSKYTSPARLLAVGFAVASVLQLYPGDDPRHLFWVGLLPIVVIFGEIGRLDIVRIKWVFPILLSSWAVIATFPQAINNATVKRERVGTGIAYGGLLVQESQKTTIDGVTRVLNNVPREEKAVFLCDDAQYATWLKRYASADRMYVTWSWQIDYPSMRDMREGTMRTNRTIIMCGAPESVASWAGPNGYKVVSSSELLTYLEKNGN